MRDCVLCRSAQVCTCMKMCCVVSAAYKHIISTQGREGSESTTDSATGADKCHFRGQHGEPGWRHTRGVSMLLDGGRDRCLHWLESVQRACRLNRHDMR